MDRKQKTGHDNVMLLAMSTLPLNLKINTYQKEEDGRTLYFKSLAQMEPHTKYVLYMLAQKGERLERIVILESTKARTEKKDGETATTLFEKRIRNYLGASEKVEIHGLDDVSDEQKEREETPCDTQLYKEGFPEIITIDLDEPIYFWRAAKAIRGAEGDRPVHLYMDMQGGDRNAVAQMNAIAELLERQKVKICGRFANDFEPKRREEPHKIRDASREYQTYELISAMDIFARYGWGDKLEEYFRERGRGDTKEKKLVRAIKEASLAISMCSSDRFDSAVRRIEALKKEFENPKRVLYNLRQIFQPGVEKGGGHALFSFRENVNNRVVPQKQSAVELFSVAVNPSLFSRNSVADHDQRRGCLHNRCLYIFFHMTRIKPGYPSDNAQIGKC